MDKAKCTCIADPCECDAILASLTGKAAPAGVIYESDWIPVKGAERAAVIAWLHRRSRMCLNSVQWWRPVRRLYLRHLAAAFRAAALSIKEGAHVATTLDDESEAFRRALRTSKENPA